MILSIVCESENNWEWQSTGSFSVKSCFLIYSAPFSLWTPSLIPQNLVELVPSGKGQIWNSWSPQHCSPWPSGLPSQIASNLRRDPIAVTVHVGDPIGFSNMLFFASTAMCSLCCFCGPCMYPKALYPTHKPRMYIRYMYMYVWVCTCVGADGCLMCINVWFIDGALHDSSLWWTWDIMVIYLFVKIYNIGSKRIEIRNSSHKCSWFAKQHRFSSKLQTVMCWKCRCLKNW